MMIAAHEWREALGLVADFLAAWQPQATTAGLGLFLAWSWWSRRRRSKASRKLRAEMADLRAEMADLREVVRLFGEAHAHELACALEFRATHPAQHEALRAGIMAEIETADDAAALEEEARLARLEARCTALGDEVALRPTKNAIEARILTLTTGCAALEERQDAHAEEQGRMEVGLNALVERCEALSQQIGTLRLAVADVREGRDGGLARDLCRAVTTLVEGRVYRGLTRARPRCDGCDGGCPECCLGRSQREAEA